MKEYIFRVWDKTHQSFLKSVDNLNFILHSNDDLYGCLPASTLMTNPYCIVEQYTEELTDSKGTRIFEGDILVENYTAEMAALGSDAHVGDVYFESGTFLIRGGGTLFDLTYSVTPNIVDGYSVVGNINENPNYL